MNTAISSRDERAFQRRRCWWPVPFYGFLDGTVIATALPDMARDFGVTAVELNIGISAYLITLAVLIPASGWIADRFGARAILLSPGDLYPCLGLLRPLHRGAYLCRHAYPSGVGGALMVPVGRLAVLRTTPKHQLIKAIAT